MAFYNIQVITGICNVAIHWTTRGTACDSPVPYLKYIVSGIRTQICYHITWKWKQLTVSWICNSFLRSSFQNHRLMQCLSIDKMHSKWRNYNNKFWELLVAERIKSLNHVVLSTCHFTLMIFITFPVLYRSTIFALSFSQSVQPV